MNKFRSLKNIICHILVFLMVIASVPAVFAHVEESKDLSYQNSRELLQAIGVISDTDLIDETYTLTRSEFLAYVARLLKIPEITEIKENYFSDLSNDGHYTSLINYFAKNGYISVGSDRVFEPDRKILAQEAYKVILCILGYGDVLEIKGTYPSNVISMANKLDLPDISAGDYITETDMANIMADMAEIPFYDIKSINSNGSVEYKVNDELTILSVYYDIKKTEGYVLGTDGMYFDNTLCAQEKMKIDDDFFETENIDYPQQYVGKYVDMYYTGEGMNKTAVICQISPQDDSIVINAKDFDIFTKDYKVKYRKDSKKSAYLNVDRSASVIYNGYAVSTEISKLFDVFKCGVLTLSDMDGNGKYDHVIITNYMNVFSGYCDEVTETFYDTLTSRSYCMKDYSVVNIYNHNYERIDFDMLSPESVLMVADYPGKYIEIISISDIVTGEVESIRTVNSSEIKITVNGEVYSVYKEINPRTQKPYRDVEAKPGYSYKYYRNIFGDIVYSQTSSRGALLVGYLVDFCRKDGINSALSFRIFGEDGNMHEYSLADKVMVDGDKVKAENVPSGLVDSDGTVNPQIVLYSLNKDNEIERLDTKELGENESDEASLLLFDDSKDDSLTVFSMGTTAKRRFGRKTLVGASTKIFKVPEDKVIKDGKYREYMFSIGAPSDFSADTKMYYAGYKTNIKHVYSDILVQYADASTSYTDPSNLLLVDCIMRTHNSEEAECDTVCGLSGGASVSVFVSDAFPKGKALPKNGDIIHYVQNAAGEMTDYVLVYDYKNDALPSEVLFDNVKWNGNILGSASGSLSQLFMCTYGYAAFMDGVSVAIASSADGDYINEITDAIDLSSFSVMVYDKNVRPGASNTYIGSAEDIKDINTWGAPDCSKVFVHYRYASVKDIIVYK